MKWTAILLLNCLIQSAVAAPRIDAVMGKDLFTNSPVTLEAKSLVITFVSATCPCSNSHKSELADLARRYPAFKFVAIHSNTEEDVANARIYFKGAALPFPVLSDGDQKMANIFKAAKTPHSFVVDGKGQIVYQGGVSNSNDFVDADRKYLREALEDLSQGRVVRTPQARAIGCAISRL